MPLSMGCVLFSVIISSGITTSALKTSIYCIHCVYLPHKLSVISGPSFSPVHVYAWFYKPCTLYIFIFPHVWFIINLYQHFVVHVIGLYMLGIIAFMHLLYALRVSITKVTYQRLLSLTYNYI